jgi:hypothetical protein
MTVKLLQNTRSLACYRDTVKDSLEPRKTAQVLQGPLV